MVTRDSGRSGQPAEEKTGTAWAWRFQERMERGEERSEDWRTGRQANGQEAPGTGVPRLEEMDWSESRWIRAGQGWPDRQDTTG